MFGLWLAEAFPRNMEVEGQYNFSEAPDIPAL